VTAGHVIARAHGTCPSIYSTHAALEIRHLMVSATEARDWALYADWCDSWGRPPAPTVAAVLDEFLASFPAKRSSQLNRVRAIRNGEQCGAARVRVPVVTKTAD
jgi:hypothetical protein